MAPSDHDGPPASWPSMGCLRSATGPVFFPGILAVLSISSDPTGAGNAVSPPLVPGAPAVAIPPHRQTAVDRSRSAGARPPRPRPEGVGSKHPLASSPAERDGASIRTRAHEPESLEIHITTNKPVVLSPKPALADAGPRVLMAYSISARLSRHGVPTGPVAIVRGCPAARTRTRARRHTSDRASSPGLGTGGGVLGDVDVSQQAQQPDRVGGAPMGSRRQVAHIRRYPVTPQSRISCEPICACLAISALSDGTSYTHLAGEGLFVSVIATGNGVALCESTYS